MAGATQKAAAAAFCVIPSSIALTSASLPVDYARAVEKGLKAEGIRTRVDERSESVGKKFRDAELAHAPYMLVLGDKEQERGAVSVRSHAEGDIGAMSVEEFATRVGKEVANA